MSLIPGSPGLGGEQSPYPPNYLAQTLSMWCLLVVHAVVFQGFLNHLVMVHFLAAVGKIHESLPCVGLMI